MNRGPLDPGRLAQRESTPFTRAGSYVQSLHRPPAFALRATARQASPEAKRKGWLAEPYCGRAAAPKPGRAKAGLEALSSCARKSVFKPFGAPARQAAPPTQLLQNLGESGAGAHIWRVVTFGILRTKRVGCAFPREINGFRQRLFILQAVHRASATIDLQNTLAASRAASAAYLT